MNNQEVFDKVVEHLVAQGQPAREGFKCFYRGPNGTKCAVGCLIPDELYDEAMEGRSASILESKFPQLQPLFSNVDPEVLWQLQNVHDLSSNWDKNGLGNGGKNHLDRIAEHFDLEPPKW